MDYVRNCWYVASWSQDLAEKPVGVKVLGEPLVLWRAGDRVVAFEDRCCHRLAPLSLGRCEEGRLRCMYHGLLFDADGACVQIPGQELIPREARVRAYPVVERHSWVWVWMGDPARADATLIPPAVGFDDPDYILGRGFLDYQAEARLINDNLLDFSHLTYVHAASFKAPADFAETRPKLTVLERGVRIERWVTNTRGPAGRDSDVPYDRYMTYDFLLPGVLLMWSGGFTAGTAQQVGFGRPDLDTAATGATFTSQAVTPTGPKTSRYFFSWGPHRRHGDEALRDVLMGVAAQAFAEDKVMIEAQQKVIDATPDPRIIPTAHDRSVTLFNQLVARLVREERAARSDAA